MLGRRVFSSSLWLCDCLCASRSRGFAGVTQWGLFLMRGTFTTFSDPLEWVHLLARLVEQAGFQPAMGYMMRYTK